MGHGNDSRSKDVTVRLSPEAERELVRAFGAPDGGFARNAQHGANRTGVEVETDRDFDDWDAARAIDPSEADRRERDEGRAIRDRARERGYVTGDRGRK